MITTSTTQAFSPAEAPGLRLQAHDTAERRARHEGVEFRLAHRPASESARAAAWREVVAILAEAAREVEG